MKTLIQSAVALYAVLVTGCSAPPSTVTPTSAIEKGGQPLASSIDQPQPAASPAIPALAPAPLSAPIEADRPRNVVQKPGPVPVYKVVSTPVARRLTDGRAERLAHELLTQPLDVAIQRIDREFEQRGIQHVRQPE